jgi:4-amino-4-deoxy-L-arabinose transferase-like glycosyltransferase
LTLSPNRGGALWALALLTALGAALRFASIDVQSFHHDEVITVIRVIPGSFGDMLHAVKGSESNPPLYYVLAWGWAKAFGSDEVGLRSLSALLGTATVPLAYCIGAELAQRRAGLIAAALVAASPMLIWYSQEARSYALLVFLCAASLLFFARALRTRSGRDLALWALASALALCSHYFAFFAVGIEALWLLIALRARWRVTIPAVLAVAAVGLALIPLISAQVNPTHIGWIEESLLSTRYFETSVSFLIGETGHVIAEPPRERYALLPAVLFGLSLLLVAAWGSRRERRGALLGVVLGLGIPLLVLLAALAGKDYVVERNLLPALIPLAVAASVGFAAERVRRLGLLLAIILCSYWIAFDVYVTQTPNLQRPDFRAITEEIGPPQGPRAVITWKLAADPVRLYLHDQAQRIYSGDWPLRTIDVISKALEGRSVTGVPRVFYPVARVRFGRLTLTRYMASRVHDIPFYVLKRVHTGFGFNAVVVDGAPPRRP